MAEYRFRPIHADHGTGIEMTGASSHLTIEVLAVIYLSYSEMVREVNQAKKDMGVLFTSLLFLQSLLLC